ncbi:MAG TPA: tetratricopeptide repeat protein [Terriglobia bacterium]|nr:tetratricopeptide repeat protein [Terriglobia bacterium]
MRPLRSRILIASAIAVSLCAVRVHLAAQHGSRSALRELPNTVAKPLPANSHSSPKPDQEHLAQITIDYPEDGSIFPPEITPPTFIWHDASPIATAWQIDVVFSDGSAAMRLKVPGERMRIGEIDPRCVSNTNKPPELTPRQASAWTWKPDGATWEAIKQHSREHPATVTITGWERAGAEAPASRGKVAILTSQDPVGAPIFYRDVPLMPSEVQKGVIKPLAPNAIPLIAWRLRYIGEPGSHLLFTGLHSCANCHSFSRDGKTLGMDLDGPANDKGLYVLASIKPQMSIRNQDTISWASFKDPTVDQPRIGFMSQVSPDGQYVVTMVKGPQGDKGNYYVANFKSYSFLQVFYPTRGILAWYNRATGQMHALPGADDPRYVHTGAVWSPDGRYLVYAQALARDPYPEGRKLAEYANDPNETPIQYDLYRIPFNGGQGGRPEPIAGASANGMSNSFPKVSPDGRWIVFVRAHNGLLMRPDSQLYIVPAQGGVARRMTCNTPLMNSWHTFSPNGRWLAFSSKSRSPYTGLFLTHLDAQGNDSPAIYVDNTTAANRAVNIPEFVNIPPGGLLKVDLPAAEFFRLFDLAAELAAKGHDEEAIVEWKKALELNPEDPFANNDLGTHLLKKGQLDQAILCFEKAVQVKPDYADAQNNLGIALMQGGKLEEASVHLQKAQEDDRKNLQTYYNLGALFYTQGKIPEALAQWHAGLQIDSDNPPLLNQTAWVLATNPAASVRNGNEAVELAERAAKISGGKDPVVLDTLAAAYAEAGRFPEAVETARQALALAAQPLADEVKIHLALYQSKRPFHETP